MKIGAYTVDLSTARRILRDPGQRRHLWRWMRSQRTGYLLDVGLPWITFDAILALCERDMRGQRVFEYGSGGSTLFWLGKGASVVSIEHDPAWYRDVEARVGARSDLDYRLVPREPAPAERIDPSDPDLYQSEDVDCRGMSFRNYVTQIDEFPEAAFDLVLVDGRARPSCIKHAASKVKPGGLLVLDNSERDYYLKKTEVLMKDWNRRDWCGVLPTLNHRSCTSFFNRSA